MAEKANAISKQFYQEEDDVDRLLLFLYILSFMTFFRQMRSLLLLSHTNRDEPFCPAPM
jgi:hypothetical protein